MTKPVSAKMGVKPGMRAIFFGAPADFPELVELPPLEVATDLRDTFDYIHCFVRQQTELREKFAQLKPHLNSTGMLWISWPKARQLETDLTITKVIEIGYDAGLVESKTLSINPVWSAIKFTHPKPGKTYHNSYGTLK